MKTNITLAIILLILLSACASNPPAAGPTIDVPTSETLAHATAIAGLNETATLQPTATDIPTSTRLRF